MLRVYALAPQTIRGILRRAFWRFQALVTVTFLGFGAYLALLPRPVRWSAAGPIVGVIALAYFLVIFFHHRQQLRLLYSMRYEIDGSSIVFRQAGQPPLRVMRADITRVTARRDGLRVETVDGESPLLIPYGLARGGDEDIRAALESWVGVSEVERPPAVPLWRLLMIGLGGSLLVLIFANSLYIILPLLAMVVGYGFYTERRISLRRDSPPGAVRLYNMAFSFLIFVIVMKSCFLSLAAMMLGR